MSKQHGKINRKIPQAITVALIGILGSIVITLISIIGPDVIEAIKKSSVPPSPTPSCISAADILVTFQISQGGKVIAEPVPGETVFLDPDLRVLFQARD